MDRTNENGRAALSVTSFSMRAGIVIAILWSAGCSTTYDCANADVTAELVEQVAINAKKPEWADDIRRNTKVGGVTTLDMDEKLGHYLCQTKLSYRDADRAVDSLDITYGVKPIAGGEREFSLEWETVDSVVGKLDPVRAFTAKIIDPWYRKEQREKQQKTLEQIAEVEKIAKERAIEYAKENPPIPLSREDLIEYATSSPQVERANPGIHYQKRVAQLIGDMNGDGHDDFADILEFEGEYSLWTYVQFPEEYAQKFSVEIFNPDYLSQSLPTEMSIIDGKIVVTHEDGSKKTVEVRKVGEPLPEFDQQKYAEIRSNLMKERGIEWNGVVQSF